MNHKRKCFPVVFFLVSSFKLLFCFFLLLLILEKLNSKAKSWLCRHKNNCYIAKFSHAFPFLKTGCKYEPINTKQMNKPMCMIHVYFLAIQCSTYISPCVIPGVWTGPLQYLHVIPATYCSDSAKWHVYAVKGTNTLHSHQQMSYTTLILSIWFKLSKISWMS